MSGVTTRKNRCALGCFQRQFTAIFPRQVLFLIFLFMIRRQHRNLSMSTLYTSFSGYKQSDPGFPPWSLYIYCLKKKKHSRQYSTAVLQKVLHTDWSTLFTFTKYLRHQLEFNISSNHTKLSIRGWNTAFTNIQPGTESLNMFSWWLGQARRSREAREDEGWFIF